MGEILLWLGTSASIIAGARVLSRRRVSFGDVARPVALAATPGLGVVLAGALSGDGRFSAVLLVVMGVWRLAASYVAVREGMAAPAGKAVAWLSLGLAGGIGLMGAGTAMLNILSTR